MADILVVDDEVTIREPLRAFLEGLGHAVTEADNGEIALRLLTERDFDLVLTDVMMPKMNGFQLLERVLPHLQERTPVLILSSMGDEAAVEAAMFAGAFDYLLKPCDPERTERILEDALRQRRAWIARLGPYRARGPGVPARVLTENPLPAAKVPRHVPLSGKVALKRRPGVISVSAPDTSPVDAPTRAPRRGLFGWLRGLLGGRHAA